MRAQGEARSAELIGEAMRNNKGFLQLRRLEAARDIATLLSDSGNKVMLDAQSLLLNGELTFVLITSGPKLTTLDSYSSERRYYKGVAQD